MLGYTYTLDQTLGMPTSFNFYFLFFIFFPFRRNLMLDKNMYYRSKTRFGLWKKIVEAYQNLFFFFLFGSVGGYNFICINNRASNYLIIKRIAKLRAVSRAHQYHYIIIKDTRIWKSYSNTIGFNMGKKMLMLCNTVAYT